MTDELKAEVNRLTSENELLAQAKKMADFRMCNLDMERVERITFLEKALEQAVGVACICVENRMLSGCRIYVYGDGDEDNAFGTEISEAPELAAYLKESKQND